MLDFDRLQTPPHDGDILIEPGPAHWPAMIEAGRRIQIDHVRLAGVEAAQLRAQTRQALWKSGDLPAILCGHQPAFIHPGVWAKSVVVAQFSERHDLAGGELVVDNDAPHSSGLTVPAAGPDGLVRIHNFTWEADLAGAAYEGRPALSAQVVEATAQQLSHLLGEAFGQSALPDYLEGSRQAQGGDIVAQHLAGRSRIDRPLGAQLRAIRVSDVFGGAFVADLLLNADRFAAVYNSALKEYRTAHQVRSADRPLPDLGRRGDQIETALWIYQPGQRRCRLWVSRQGDAICLLADQSLAGRIGVQELTRDPDAALAGLGPWLVRPRALTLTLWARLLACDLFVHGIGGAKYDRVTDRIFRRYYGFEPPPLACVSATLQLPLPRHPQAETEQRAARQRRRDLLFNPHRYVADLPAAVMERRRALIDESGRLRANRASRPDRRRVFLELRQLNAELARTQPAVQEQLDAAVAMLADQYRSHLLASGRQYFYALQPRQRLIDLAEQLAEAVGPVRSPRGLKPAARSDGGRTARSEPGAQATGHSAWTES